jgi:hypothetical protein
VVAIVKRAFYLDLSIYKYLFSGPLSPSSDAQTCCGGTAGSGSSRVWTKSDVPDDINCTGKLYLAFVEFDSKWTLTMPLTSAPRLAPEPQFHKGVNLPMVVLGTGSGQHGDVANATTTWIAEAGGTGIDTAYDYQDEASVLKSCCAPSPSARVS